MTEPDALDCSIRDLLQLQKEAWHQLAKPALTRFEARELRNQIKQSGIELRRYIEQRSQLLRRDRTITLLPS
jgi:hypothetical protein